MAYIILHSGPRLFYSDSAKHTIRFIQGDLIAFHKPPGFAIADPSNLQMIPQLITYHACDVKG